MNRVIFPVCLELQVEKGYVSGSLDKLQTVALSVNTLSWEYLRNTELRGHSQVIERPSVHFCIMQLKFLEIVITVAVNNLKVL